MTQLAPNSLRLAESALLATLMALPTLMSVAMDRSYEIAKLSVLLPLAALAIGAWIIGVRPAQCLPEAGQAGWRLPRKVWVAVGVLAIVISLTVLLSDTGALVFFGTHIRREGAVVWLAYLVMFCTAAATLRAPGAMERFLDALLLSSLIPVAYALQQRIGLDFFVTPLADPGRSAGTMGNPNFLAGYLALLLPLTLMRAWLTWADLGAAPRARGTSLLWYWLAAWQGLALLQTQSRGPLLASLVVLGFVACLAAARVGARNRLYVAAALLAALVLFLLLLNLSPALARWAGDWPVLNRLIFAAHADVGAGTALAARSVNARLGIWQAATEGLAAAPLAVKLFGYGPDAASMHFLPHVPVQLMTSEGYQQISTFDRTHADMLEIAASFGLFGWFAWMLLFGAVMQVAARALLGWSARRGGLGLAAVIMGCGSGSALAAAVAGLPYAAPAAFGLGLAFGWMAFVAWHALADLQRGLRASLERNWLMLAGLTAALLVAWLDAQVNIPVIATRVATFALAAAVLVQAHQVRLAATAPIAIGSAEPRQPGLALPEDAPSFSIGWLTAIGLIAALSSFFGISLDDRVHGPGLGLWFLKVPGVVVFVAFAAVLAWVGARRDQASVRFTMMRLLLWLTLPAAVFLGGTLVLGEALERSADAALPQWIGGLSVWVGGVLVGLCVWRSRPSSFGKPVVAGAGAVANAVRAAPAAKRKSLASVGRMQFPARRSSAGGETILTFARFLCAGAVLCLASWFCWQQIVADVAYNLAEWARRSGRPEARALFLGVAANHMPHERHYLRPHVFDALESAALRLPEVSSPSVLAGIHVDLGRAEAWARQSLARYPNDPWLVMALANVRQHQGLSILPSAGSDEGAQAIADARRLYARAAALYPAQPLIYLGLAQLEFDLGDLEAAYHQLDRMEQLIPASPVPYRERILVALAVRDQGQVEAALMRASRHLSSGDVAALRSVAQAQQ